MTENRQKLVIVSGSSRKSSLTLRVALHLNKAFSDKFDIDVIDLREYHLPFIDEAAWAEKSHAPEEFQHLWQTMNDADAFVLVTPEYNGSYSAGLKNFLDHMPKSTYTRKAFGIVTASPGALGGIRAAMQLILLACGLFAVPSPTLLVTPFVDKKFDSEGNLTDESFSAAVNNFVNDLTWLSQSIANRK